MRHREGKQKEKKRNKSDQSVTAGSRVFEHGKFRRSKDKGPECILRRRERRERVRGREERASCLTQNVWRKQPTVKHSIQWRLDTLDCGGVGGAQVTRLNIERAAYFERFVRQPFVRPSDKKSCSANVCPDDNSDDQSLLYLT